MIVLDTTIVNVALPSIRLDLGFSETSLAWVVNAYVLTFGGFLLLGGRLGDLLGTGGSSLLGLALFTLSSLACGLSNTDWLLIGARAVQGIGGAIVNAVGPFALWSTSFLSPTSVPKRWACLGLSPLAAVRFGVLLGGVLTGLLSWHWIFLGKHTHWHYRLPAMYLLCSPTLKASTRTITWMLGAPPRLPLPFFLAVYAVINGNEGRVASRSKRLGC